MARASLVGWQAVLGTIIAGGPAGGTRYDHRWWAGRRYSVWSSSASRLPTSANSTPSSTHRLIANAVSGATTCSPNTEKAFTKLLPLSVVVQQTLWQLPYSECTSFNAAAMMSNVCAPRSLRQASAVYRLSSVAPSIQWTVTPTPPTPWRRPASAALPGVHRLGVLIDSFSYAPLSARCIL